MDQQLKQRLVGAVVLISLAVIFIPMLLDQNDPSSLPHFGSAVPERPNFQFDPIEIPLQVPPAVEPDAAVVVEKDTPKAVAAAEPAPAPIERSVEADKPAAATPPPAASTVITPDSQALAWAVQVGSFDKEANAAALRDRLREKGFAAYLERVKVEGRMHYRVRVGPELQRELAESLRDRLEEKAKLKGIVVRHPS